MAIRDWTPRTIRRVWIATSVIQLALLLPWAVQQYRRRHPAPLPPLSDSIPGIFTGMDSARRVTLLAKLRDSVGIVLSVHGDTITDMSLTPQGAARLRPVVATFQFGLERVAHDALPYLIVMLVLVVSPTLVAAGVTACWFWLRRRPGRTTMLGDG